jgi:hypothetical protein
MRLGSSASKPLLAQHDAQRIQSQRLGEEACDRCSHASELATQRQLLHLVIGRLASLCHAPSMPAAAHSMIFSSKTLALSACRCRNG